MIDSLKSRYLSIDLLRILSICFVLISHYGLRPYIPFGNFFDGTHGVVIFFMISGYCMKNSLQSRTAKEFLWARFLRLTPALLICATFTMIIEMMFANLRPDRLQTIPDFLFNLMCLPIGNLVCDIFTNLKGRPVMYSWVDGAYWSLLVEIRFYLLLAFLCYAFKIKSIAITLSLLCILASFNFEFSIISKGKDFFLYLSFFAYGYAFKSFIEGNKKALISLFFSYSIFSLNCFVGAEAISMVLDASLWVSYSACFLIFSTVVAYCPNHGSIFRRRLGYLTYPIYLLHQDIGLIIIESIRPYIGQISSAFIAAIISALLAIVVQRLVNQGSNLSRRYFLTN
jgi:peptidoglycan/LPS O-acetylase OafA/YrhL